MLEQLLDFAGCSSIQFFNPFFVPYETPRRVRGQLSHLIFRDLRDPMPCHRPLLSSLTFPAQPWEAEDFPKAGKYFNHVPLLT